jgi:hypothetical protein
VLTPALEPYLDIVRIMNIRPAQLLLWNLVGTIDKVNGAHEKERGKKQA